MKQFTVLAALLIAMGFTRPSWATEPAAGAVKGPDICVYNICLIEHPDPIQMTKDFLIRKQPPTDNECVVKYMADTLACHGDPTCISRVFYEALDYYCYNFQYPSDVSSLPLPGSDTITATAAITTAPIETTILGTASVGAVIP